MAGSELPLESISFLNHKDSIHLPIYCKFCPSNDIVTIFSVQMQGRLKLTLPLKRSRSSQGHDLYKLCRALLPDASCQVSKSLAFWFWRRRFLKVFAIYSHGGHLGHMTMTIYIYFHSHFLIMLLIKFGFDWPSSFREENL